MNPKSLSFSHCLFAVQKSLIMNIAVNSNNFKKSFGVIKLTNLFRVAVSDRLEKELNWAFTREPLWPIKMRVGNRERKKVFFFLQEKEHHFLVTFSVHLERFH